MSPMDCGLVQPNPPKRFPKSSKDRGLLIESAEEIFKLEFDGLGENEGESANIYIFSSPHGRFNVVVDVIVHVVVLI